MLLAWCKHCVKPRIVKQFAFLLHRIYLQWCFDWSGHVFLFPLPCFQDCLFSFLPLAHMFERLVEAAAFQVGARVGYFKGDVRTMAEDIKELRPTIIPLVPRVLNRIYDKVY